jgi:hypothetical protein
MRIITLLEGIFTELKLLNENLEKLSVFNENTSTISFLKQLAAAADSHFDEKEQKERLNPLREMTETEIFSLKHWVNFRIEEKEISIEDISLGNGCIKNQVIKFLASKRNCTKIARDAISAALGYATFYDLVKDWRKEGMADAAFTQTKGGVA